MESEENLKFGYAQQVPANGSTSDLHSVFLALLLFLLYINDLPLFVNSEVGLCTDDTILYSFLIRPYYLIRLLQLFNAPDHLIWYMNFDPEKSV